MWHPIRRACPEEMQPSGKSRKQNSYDRKKHNNYTSMLEELAQMLPNPLRTSCTRLTKKEILLEVLRYIEHLQTSIDTARSLLQVHSGEQKAKGSEQVVPSAMRRGRRESTPRGKKSKPLGVCKKPRKKRHTRKSEWQGVSKKAVKRLPLESGKDAFQVDLRKKESLPRRRDVSTVFPFYQKKQSACFPSFQLPVLEANRPAHATCLDITKDGNLGEDREESKKEDVFSACATQVAYDELCMYFEGPGHLPMRQELVPYYSSCEEDGEEEVPTASPWLSAQTPEGGSHRSMQLCSPGIGAQSNTCFDLGLSPSLFSSPTRLLPKNILQGSQDELSPVLFEDVYQSPKSSSFSQTLSGTLLRKSALTLDHCYLSYNEMDKNDSSPTSRGPETTFPWNKQFFQEETATCRPECSGTSSDENSDITWTPCKRAKPSQVACQRNKRGGGRQKQKQRQKRSPGGHENRSNSSPLQLKKKCVNGFIMFCRLNRKHYIRAYPGMASTVATRELARLWRLMTKQERKPYCTKARTFSRLNNRIVRNDFSSGEEDDLEPPKPFQLLLAEKSLSGPQSFGDFCLLELIP